MKHRFLRTLVKLGIILGMLCGIALLVYVSAFILPQFVGVPAINGVPTWEYIASYTLAVLCFVGLEYIAIVLYGMMRSLDDDPFVETNVRALRRMGVAALLVAACGIATMAFEAVPLAVLGALPIGMCGLFSLVLSGVFERAVYYKRENDLTV